MLLLTLFLENMIMKGPFSPYLSLSQIDSKMFSKNGYKILKFRIWSNSCKTILQFPQGTLGPMMKFATKFICI